MCPCRDGMGYAMPFSMQKSQKNTGLEPKITSLENGLRIATLSMQEAESVVCGVWVDIGTRDEIATSNGVAHLVEHMMFKGTAKRSAFALSAAIEGRGGSMNAHTAHEETAYYARLLPEDMPLAVDVLADMLQNSRFAPKELAREKDVVIQEIGRAIDSPEDHIFDLANQTGFAGQALGRPILGTAEIIAAMPRDVVTGYVVAHYVAANMVVVGVGRVDHDAFVREVRRRFANLPAGKPRPKRMAAKVKGGHLYQPRDCEQLHMIMGFPSVGVHHKDYAVAQVLSVLVGGSSSSRLFQHVREKLGLAYSVSAMQIAYGECGIFQIYAGTDPKRAKELTTALIHEMWDVTESITEKELDRAKTQIIADMRMGQENVMRRAEVLGTQMLTYGKPVAMADSLARITKVDVAGVEAFAARLLKGKPVMAVLGDVSSLDSYATIATRLRG